MPERIYLVIKKASIWTGILLFFIALGMALGEGYLRWRAFSLPSHETHLPHPYRQTILRPNAEIEDGEVLDSEGFRQTGPTRVGNRVYRILALGDSCTFSAGSSTQACTYPFLLEEQLAETFSRPVEVLNAGVPGYNSLQMLLYMHEILKNRSFDEVFVYGGWNDFRVLMHDRGLRYIENNGLGLPKMYRHATYWELRRPDTRPWERLLGHSFLFNHLRFKWMAHFEKKRVTDFWKNHPLSQLPEEPLIIDKIFENFRNNLEGIIAMARGRGMEVSLITLATPLRKRYSGNQEKAIRERFGHDFYRLTPSETTFYVTRFNAVIRELSTKYTCRLYDWARWNHDADDVTLFRDIVHPGDRGYRLLVDKIVEQRETLTSMD